MKLKNKVRIYNFIPFAIIFFAVRYILSSNFELGRIPLVLITALLTVILAPKFMVSKVEGEEKLFMTWFFIKKPKEL